MSGHSKWATTKHKKAANDAKRSKMFAKLIKAIEVAAKLGGADIAGNPGLQDAVHKAKKNSVPNDNIDRAIKRGAGLTGENISYHNLTYEGYGPGGVAFLVECLTDNKNRAAADVRTAMSRNGGTMADPGSVAYNFQRKALVLVPNQPFADAQLSEDDVLAAVLEAGAEDVASAEGQGFEVVAEASCLSDIRRALDDAGIAYDSADAELMPLSRVEVDQVTAQKVLRLIDALEDSEEVQNIYTNADLPAEMPED